MDKTLKDKIYACWLGKTIAGGLGAAYEGVPYRLSLTEKDLVLDTGPNDDLELQLLWLVYAEQHGMDLDHHKLSEAWKNDIEYGMDEYGVSIWNLKRGLLPPQTGFLDNYFSDGMGAAIRSEVWACLCAGKPQAAAYYAMCDACVDHCEEGVWGEMFLAATESCAFFSDSVEDAFKKGLQYIDPNSEIYDVVTTVMDLYAKKTPFDEMDIIITRKFDDHNFTNVVMNMGFIVSALLYGEGNFEKTVLIALNWGRDTDCTAATLGAIFGIIYGKEKITERWLNIVSDEIAVNDFFNKFPIPNTLTELAQRTITLADEWAKDKRMEGEFPPYAPIKEMESPFPPYSWLIVRDKTEKEMKDIIQNNKITENGEITHFSSIHYSLGEFAKHNGTLDLFTDITVKEDCECQLMICCDTGFTAWLDGKQIINQHNRQKRIPSFHRVEGGAAVTMQLKGNQRYRLRVRPIFCRESLGMTVAIGDIKNQYIDFSADIDIIV